MSAVRIRFIALGAALVVAVAGCSGDSAKQPSAARDGALIVGSAKFAESELLMNIYAGALKAKGVSVTTKPQIGARAVYLQALKDGSIDLVPEYSGSLLANYDKTATAVSSADVYAALPKVIDKDFKVLEQSTAEDKDSINVTKETATKYNLKAIGDLKDVAKDLILGGAPEFQTRAEGVPGLKAKYGVEFGSFKVTDAGGPATVTALKNNQVQAANLFSTDTAIAANGFVTLEDPLNLYGSQNVLPLIKAAKSTPTIESALNAVSAKLTTAILIDLNSKVAASGDSAKVANDWLKEQGLAS